MRIAEFDYELPEEMIAQRPISPRDSSRLLVLRRTPLQGSAQIEHRIFRELPEFLRPGDLLVLNDTRVMPARLLGAKQGSGGKAEVFLLKETEPDVWDALVRPGRRLTVGAVILFGEDALCATVQAVHPDGSRTLCLSPGPGAGPASVKELIHVLGEIPLPPYVTDGPPPDEREVYQTVYAREEGSSAAPTAGLHFTPELFATLVARNVDWAFVTLHVGLGTFKPVQTEHAEDHRIHEEFISVSQETADRINGTRANGGRIVAVGTTSARTLESVADETGAVHPYVGSTRLYILPGYRFKVVDALVTNFHMPRSTLLLLISALAGRERILESYREALRARYRFLSFGDAMLII